MKTSQDYFPLLMKLTFIILFVMYSHTSLLAQRIPTLGASTAFESDLTYLMRTDGLDETHIIAVYKSATSSVSSVTSDLYAIVGTMDTLNKSIA